jgi:hypothetical protein
MIYARLALYCGKDLAHNSTMESGLYRLYQGIEARQVTAPLS